MAENYYISSIKHLLYIILLLLSFELVAQLNEMEHHQIDSLIEVKVISTSLDTIEVPFVHQVIFNYEYDISGLNDTLHEAYFTVDVVLFLSDYVSFNWANLQEEFRTADKAFREAGVQLNLKKAVNVSFPAEWNNQVAEDITALPDSGQTPGFYDQFSLVQTVLTNKMVVAFSDFIYDEKHKDRTIFLLPISGMKLVFGEKDTDGSWKVSAPYPTGALSYPAYVFQDRIPRNLRGVITQQQSNSFHRTLAHEMGHKLINVSHEGLSKSPAFGGATIPGLMGYGSSLKIYGGEVGRWHKERLLKSPFLYKMVDGEQIWNRDYMENGVYDDPIYGGFIMPD